MTVTSTRQPVRRIRLRHAVIGVLTAIAVLVGGLGLLYRDQIVRYMTHLKGSPTETAPWTPFPASDPPTLHLAVAGDVGDSPPTAVELMFQTVRPARASRPAAATACHDRRRSSPMTERSRSIGRALIWTSWSRDKHHPFAPVPAPPARVTAPRSHTRVAARRSPFAGIARIR
jgi:hypothetical protein